MESVEMQNEKEQQNREKSGKNRGWLVMMFGCISKYGNICIYRLKIAIK
jgi:hypothetical protein